MKNLKNPKTILVLMVLATMLLGAWSSACPPPPEKPECPEGQVLSDGGESVFVPTTYKKVCRYYGYRWNWHTYQLEKYCKRYRTVVDVPAYWTDPVCEVPAVAKEGCAFEQYILIGNGTCSIIRNRALGDLKTVFPVRIGNIKNGKLTEYGQTVCNQCRVTPFKWNGDFHTSCKEPCVNCQY
jgi:hypothetical protein